MNIRITLPDDDRFLDEVTASLMAFADRGPAADPAGQAPTALGRCVARDLALVIRQKRKARAPAAGSGE
jgi:hypothetical protein